MMSCMIGGTKVWWPTERKDRKNIYKQVGFTHASERDFHNFQKIWPKILELGFHYSIKKPTKQCIQDLMIDTQNAVTHLDIKILNHFSTLQNTTNQKLKILLTFYKKTMTYNKTSS